MKRKRKGWRRTKLLLNTQVQDSSAKLIFEDNEFCSQFLKDYVNLPYMNSIKSENIKDVSTQFVPLFSEERNADRVKEIKLDDEKSFFFISLIEHKSKVDYNVFMQIFRYMVYIWERYEKEQEAKHPGISKTKEFQYPPVLPIIYYEGKDKWSVPEQFTSRIMQAEQFKGYIPDFTYYLVPIHNYSNEELMQQGDDISFMMLINKLQTQEDVEAFSKLSPERLNEILEEIPENRRTLIAKVFLAFLLKVNVPTAEAEELAGKVKEKKMGQLFENMEKMDIQAERKKTAEAIENGIRILVENSQVLGATKKYLTQKLEEEYKLSAKEAKAKVRKYWK